MSNLKFAPELKKSWFEDLDISFSGTVTPPKESINQPQEASDNEVEEKIMSNLGMSATLRNNMLDEITAYAGGNALLRIYDGTQPATGGAPTTLLAQLTMNATFAPAASAGVLTLNAITADSSANAGAPTTATWFRIVQSDGSTHVLDGDVSTTGAGTGDLQLDDTSIVLGGTVALGGPNTITAPNA